MTTREDINPALVAPRAQTGHAASGADPPSIAIIITCWNYQDYVGEAISSVLQQARDDYELLVIDDGSTDESWAVITAMGVRACRIDNVGHRRACLHGLKLTSAPFVLFLDADDQLLPGALDTILARLDPQVAKLQFPLIRIDSDRKIISGPVPPLADQRGRILTEHVLKTGSYMTPPTSGNVFRRDVCTLAEHADYDRWIDGVALFAAPFMGDIVSLSAPQGLYRVHGRNDSGFSNELDPLPLQRELVRFEARLEHLRDILRPQGLAGQLVTLDKAYFFQERTAYVAIATGQALKLRQLRKLLHLLWTDPQQTPFRLPMTLFFTLLFLLPRAPARRALSYRMRAGHRSLRGLAGAIWG